MDTNDRFANFNKVLAELAKLSAKFPAPTNTRPMPDRLVVNNFQTQIERMPYDRRNS